MSDATLQVYRSGSTRSVFICMSLELVESRFHTSATVIAIVSVIIIIARFESFVFSYFQNIDCRGMYNVLISPVCVHTIFRHT